jgi:hypothetical protein
VRAGDDGPPAGCVGPDEDGDGWPNACDNCVVDPNPDQADMLEAASGADPDGVGDVCDPRPTLGDDYVAIFEAHEQVGAIYSVSGAAATGSGGLRLGAPGESGQLHFATPPRVTRLDTAYRVVAASAAQQWIGMWNSVGPGMSEALFAESSWTPPAPDHRFTIKEQSAMPDRYAPEITAPDVIRPADHVRLVTDTALLTGGDQRLRVVDLVTSIEQTTSINVTVPLVNKGVLESKDITADFEYLAVYAIR